MAENGQIFHKNANFLQIGQILRKKPRDKQKKRPVRQV